MKKDAAPAAEPRVLLAEPYAKDAPAAEPVAQQPTRRDRCPHCHTEWSADRCPECGKLLLAPVEPEIVAMKDGLGRIVTVTRAEYLISRLAELRDGERPYDPLVNEVVAEVMEYLAAAPL